MSRKLVLAALLAVVGTGFGSLAGPAEAAALPGPDRPVVKSDLVTEIRYVRRGPVYYSYRPGPRVYLYAGVPAVTYYSGYSGGHCGWLYRQARGTGSPYWWRRYRNEC